MYYGYGPAIPLGGLTVSRSVFKRVEQIDAPTGTIVTLATIKSHLRVTHSEEDAYITTLINTATEAAEMYTNRKLLPRTVKMWMDFIPGRGGSLWIDGSVQAPIGFFGGSSYRYFELIGTPIAEVTEFGYIDSAGNSQVVPVTDYIADVTDPDMPARIVLQMGAVWPFDTQIAHSIYVEYTQGYTDAASIPAPLKHGVMVMAAALWSNRGDALDHPTDVMQFPAVKSLYDPYRVLTVSTI